MSFNLQEKADIFRLLADPTRINILKILDSDKEYCVTEISQSADLSLSAASHQLRKLEMLGVVDKCRQGQEICYCINKKSGLAQKLLKLIRV